MSQELPYGAQKAGKSMKVYISGFQGPHPITTGVAYWYRGHYLYSSAGVPVEPIPFATKKGVHVVGTTVDTAPLFRMGALGDVNELEVAALEKSKVWEWQTQEQEKALQKEELEKELEKAARTTSAFSNQTDEITNILLSSKSRW